MGDRVRAVQWMMMLLVVFLCNGSVSFAADQLDESKQLFFNQFRYAVQAHDVNQLIHLTHPKSLECISNDDLEYYYGKVLDGLVKVLGKRQALRSVTAVDFAPGEISLSKDLPSGDSMKWPVAPEARIFIQYEREGSEAVASLYISKDANDWKWIHICTK